MKARHIVWALVLIGAAGTARASSPSSPDFTLTGTQHVDVTWAGSWAPEWPGATLFDSSSITMWPGGGLSVVHAWNTSTAGMIGGTIFFLSAYDSSTVNISGGGIAYEGELDAWDTSTVNISGGSAGPWFRANDSSIVNISGGSITGGGIDSVGTPRPGGLFAGGSSTVNISGGSITSLDPYNTSVVNLSGGSVAYLYAGGRSTTMFNARNFLLGSGLTLDGNRVLGTGYLSGEWLNGTPWSVNILENDPGAMIELVPEPATLGLLVLGGLALLRRRRGGEE